MDSFEGKLAVVTGGGGGMGRELVLQLTAAGCSVATCDLDLTAAAETTTLAGASAPAGVTVTAHSCDVSDEAAVNRFRDEVLAEHRTDHVELLFNNAGIVGAGSFLVDDRAAWERVFGVCWGGVYNCSRAFVPLLVASEEACLVNTSSANGFWATHGPGAPSTAYGTAKFAVKGFSEALIEDLRTHAPHVSVALVLPGHIGTAIGTKSAHLLADGDLDELRAILAGVGIPLDGMDDDELRRAAEHLGEIETEFAPTSAARAATLILDAVLAGRWRVLVGDDVRALDEAARADPESIYEPDFPGVGPDWLLPMLMLRSRFDPGADPDLAMTAELRFQRERIVVRVADGQLDARREAAIAPDVLVDVDPEALYGLLVDRENVGAAEAAGRLRLAGDRKKFERLLGTVQKQKQRRER